MMLYNVYLVYFAGGKKNKHGWTSVEKRYICSDACSVGGEERNYAFTSNVVKKIGGMAPQHSLFSPWQVRWFMGLPLAFWVRPNCTPPQTSAWGARNFLSEKVCPKRVIAMNKMTKVGLHDTWTKLHTTVSVAAANWNCCICCSSICNPEMPDLPDITRNWPHLNLHERVKGLKSKRLKQGEIGEKGWGLQFVVLA